MRRFLVALALVMSATLSLATLTVVPSARAAAAAQSQSPLCELAVMYHHAFPSLVPESVVSAYCAPHSAG
jgi:hypothetical protein